MNQLNNKRKQGNKYEDKACEYLLSKGHRILARNFSCKTGEIDIVSKSPEHFLVITEVKHRSSSKFGSSFEAVDLHKQKKISQTTLYYLMTHGISTDCRIRFDVIAFDGEELSHIENAFEYIGN